MIVALTTVAAATLPSAGHAEDKLLAEAVQFNGTILYLSTKVPGLIFGAVRNGETAFAGFGEIADGSDKVPGGDTMFRIASVSKVFCGSVLSSLVIDGKVQLTDRLQDRLGYDVTLPEKDGRALRLVEQLLACTVGEGEQAEVRAVSLPDFAAGVFGQSAPEGSG